MTRPSPLKADPDRPLGLMFSGGGARGAFQVGVWRELLDNHRGLNGRKPLVISGTSAGAINGALITAGLEPDQMLDFWLSLAERPPVRANPVFFKGLEAVLGKLAQKGIARPLKRRSREARILYGLLGKHRWFRSSDAMALLLEFVLTARFDNVSTILDAIPTSHLFSTDMFRDRLRDFIGSDHLPRSDIRLAINTVAIGTGSVLRIVNHPPLKRPQSARHYLYEPRISLDMITASASIPLLFNPVKVADRLLWDGGLLVNSPMAPAVALGARRLIPVLVTTGKGNGRSPTENFGVAVERLVDTFLENAYNIDRKLLLSRNALADKLPEENLRVVELYKAIRPVSSRLFDAGSYLYFEKDAMMSMYEAGRVAARNWLMRGPRVDRRQDDEG